MNRKSLQCINACSRIVYSDASNSGCAGYEVNTYKGIVHGMWDSQESAQSSTWRELCAVYRVLISLQDVLMCQRIKWFTDNTNVSNIVAKGSMKENLQELALRIYQFCSKNCIHLETEWLPRAQHEKADYLSKVIERDDWGISNSIVQIIMQKWGCLDVDYFASVHNAKLPHFYSRFCCREAIGVDAFTYDWGHGLGLFVLLTILVPRVLSKMSACKACGIPIVPEWRSAPYWPILCPQKSENFSHL